MTGSPRSFEDRYVFDHLLTLFTAISGSANGMLEVVTERYRLPDVSGQVRDLLAVEASLLSDNKATNVQP